MCLQGLHPLEICNKAINQGAVVIKPYLEDIVLMSADDPLAQQRIDNQET